MFVVFQRYIVSESHPVVRLASYCKSLPIWFAVDVCLWVGDVRSWLFPAMSSASEYSSTVLIADPIKSPTMLAEVHHQC